MKQASNTIWNKTKTGTPKHKALVLCKNKNGDVFPAIFYDNQSFLGFYPFTTFYENELFKHYYSKVVFEPKFTGVIEWATMPQ